jgi:hypothetical protein
LDWQPTSEIATLKNPVQLMLEIGDEIVGNFEKLTANAAKAFAVTGV